jgi:hypothetical protein
LDQPLRPWRRRVVAISNAAEAEAEGKKNTTPFWRTLKSNGELNPKYPGDVSALRRKLSVEGHKIIRKGKRFFVAGFEEKISDSKRALKRMARPTLRILQ